MAESANANSSEYPSGSGAGHEASGNNHSGSFDCNICLEISKDTVISMCGHLFCWPCLHRWIETQSPRATCPVCKAAISRDKIENGVLVKAENRMKDTSGRTKIVRRFITEDICCRIRKED